MLSFTYPVVRALFAPEDAIRSSHPSQEGLEALSDLLPLSIASLCDDVNDCVFISSCRQ